MRLEAAVLKLVSSISGLVVEYIVAIDVTRARFPADAPLSISGPQGYCVRRSMATALGLLPPLGLRSKVWAQGMCGCCVPAETTPRGFEPLRAEPNGFLVHLLSHSDTVS